MEISKWLKVSKLWMMHLFLLVICLHIAQFVLLDNDAVKVLACLVQFLNQCIVFTFLNIVLVLLEE